MDAFVEWIAATRLSAAINRSVWLWPAAETFHFIGLSFFIGVVAFFDLRLMGFFKRVPLDVAKRLMPLAAMAFLVNLVTGLIFLIGIPSQYVHNAAWRWKVIFLAIAGVNAVVFEVFVSRRAISLPHDTDTPLSAKAIGAVSLVAWLGVIYFGRMLAFVGESF